MEKKISAEKLLARYLELAHGPYNERRHQIIEREIPRELSAWEGDKAVNVRELLQTTAIVGTTLVPAQVLATLIEGSEPAICMREMVPIFTATGPSMVVPKGETGTYAGEIAEGAEYPMDEIAYGAATYTIKNYGLAPGITNNMIADGLWDVVAAEVSKAGRKCENTLNQVALSVLLENSGAAHDTAGSNQGLKAVASAQAAMVGNGFIPDRLVMHPQAMGILMSEFTPAGGYYAVGDQVTTGVLPGQILGMKAGVCGVADDSATYTWGYNTNDYIGMLLLSSGFCGGIAMRQDLSVEEFNDVVRDLKRFRVKVRFGAQYHHANAAQRVQY